jgi:hypothetical protein
MVGLGFSKDMGLMRYILKLWKLLRGTSGEFGHTRIMFTLGPLRVKTFRIVPTHVQYRNVWAAYGRLCSLIPGLSVKLSAIIFAGPPPLPGPERSMFFIPHGAPEGYEWLVALVVLVCLYSC